MTFNVRPLPCNYCMSASCLQTAWDELNSSLRLRQGQKRLLWTRYPPKAPN